MVIRRVAVASVCLALNVALLSACSGGPNGSADRPGGASPDAARSATPTASTASSSAKPSSPGSPSEPDRTAPAQLVPKVSRSGQPDTPTTSAKPASVDGTVKYPDGVALRIANVAFSKEKLKGPGSFPGRPYALLKLEISNKSRESLSMQTVVITVLDKHDQAVPPVYSREAKVQDFSGTLKPAETARARYAFAVPKSSWSKVTVVVDFDGVHTSAVFLGKLQ
jgi:hypothetical protein